MKNIYLKTIIFFSLISSIVTAQITETEPNNTFTEANDLSENITVTGLIADYPNPDVYRIILPEDGKIIINTTIAGEGTNPNAPFTFTLFNEEENPWNSHSPLKGENGMFMSDVNEWCCILQDTFYIEVNSGYVFPYLYNYTLSWELIPATYDNDIEPNSVFTQALPLMYNTSTEGHLSFVRDPQAVGQDGIDFYSIVPPVNGTLRVFIETEAQSTGSNNMNMNIHTIDGSAWYGQTTTVGGFQSPNVDTILWGCVGNDTMYLSLTTTNVNDRGYSYKMRYDMLPMVFANDAEPNGSFESAQLVDPAIPIEGNQYLGNYYYWSQSQQEDIYKFYKPDTGYFKIVAYAETHTTDATGGHSIQLYDSNFNPVGPALVAPIGINSIPSVDSLNFAYLAADTFYIKTFSNYAFAACRSYRLQLSYVGLENTVEQIDQASISVYPNPSRGHFFLNANGFSGKGNLQVFDVLGKIVHEQNFNTIGQLEVAMNESTPGIYFIKVAAGNERFLQRIIIE